LLGHSPKYRRLSEITRTSACKSVSYLLGALVKFCYMNSDNVRESLRSAKLHHAKDGKLRDLDYGETSCDKMYKVFDDSSHGHSGFCKNIYGRKLRGMFGPFYHKKIVTVTPIGV
jgi:hypothetical protein